MLSEHKYVSTFTNYLSCQHSSFVIRNFSPPKGMQQVQFREAVTELL